jgi:hypothetical protein
MKHNLYTYQKQGFLRNENGVKTNMLLFVTPCEFRMQQMAKEELNNNLKKPEKVGGVFWVKPGNEDNKLVHLIHKICYTKNVIHANPRADMRNEMNSYLPDYRELNDELMVILSNGYIPVLFSSSETYENDTIIPPEREKPDLTLSYLFMTILPDPSIQFIMPKLMLNAEFVAEDWMLKD